MVATKLELPSLGWYRLVSQMQVSLAACREPAGKLWQLCKVLYGFEHKTQSVDPCSIYPQICFNTHMFCIAAIFVKYCYTTVSCCNVWDNSCCSGCSPLGEKSSRNGTITVKGALEDSWLFYIYIYIWVRYILIFKFWIHSTLSAQ